MGKKTIVSVILLVSITCNCLGGNHHENHKQFEEEMVQSHSKRTLSPRQRQLAAYWRRKEGLILVSANMPSYISIGHEKVVFSHPWFESSNLSPYSLISSVCQETSRSALLPPICLLLIVPQTNSY